MHDANNNWCLSCATKCWGLHCDHSQLYIVICFCIIWQQIRVNKDKKKEVVIYSNRIRIFLFGKSSCSRTFLCEKVISAVRLPIMLRDEKLINEVREELLFSIQEHDSGRYISQFHLDFSEASHTVHASFLILRNYFCFLLTEHYNTSLKIFISSKCCVIGSC